MGISDSADRLRILQQIITMRADLVTSGTASPIRRMRSPIKGRQFADHLSSSSSSSVTPSLYAASRHVSRGGSGGGGGGGGSSGNRPQRSGSGSAQNFNNMYVNVLMQQQQNGNSRSRRTSDSGTSVVNSSCSQLSSSSATDPTSSEASQEGSRISSPDRQLQQDLALSDPTHRRELENFNKLRAVATLRYHNVKRLSRSLDHLFPVSSTRGGSQSLCG